MKDKSITTHHLFTLLKGAWMGEGNVEDHVHVVVSISPKLAVADCVHHLKGASAYATNHMAGSDGKFKWQGGYGALTIGERSLETVMQ